MRFIRVAQARWREGRRQGRQAGRHAGRQESEKRYAPIGQAQQTWRQGVGCRPDAATPTAVMTHSPSSWLCTIVRADCCCCEFRSSLSLAGYQATRPTTSSYHSNLPHAAAVETCSTLPCKVQALEQPSLQQPDHSRDGRRLRRGRGDCSVTAAQASPCSPH